MAENQDDNERSEDPTQKKRDDALERGDVVKSQEVNTWFIISAGALVMFAFAEPAAASLQTMLRGLLANMHTVRTDGGGLLILSYQLSTSLLAILALPLLVLVLAAIGGNMIQHPLVWSGEQLKPKLSRLSPIEGAKRLFSKLALVNFIKGLAKLGIVSCLMLWLVWPETDRIYTLVNTDIRGTLALTENLSLKLLAAVAVILAFIAALDYGYQYKVWFARQKMSLRQLKEEFRQSEGDPVVKGKLRQLRQSRMRKRMMAAVPQASVVITNPTHFAVALKYERGMAAPVCLAKGVDVLALKIREVAAAHRIPIVENPPLARALHAGVEIDQEIPVQHYKAVAEVIGYIMKLRKGFAR
jgi:flagellar biosynthetic protein FlhB